MCLSKTCKIHYGRVIVCLIIPASVIVLIIYIPVINQINKGSMFYGAESQSDSIKSLSRCVAYIPQANVDTGGNPIFGNDIPVKQWQENTMPDVIYTIAKSYVYQLLLLLMSIACN